MENLESLQLSSLLSTYDQGQGKLTVHYEGFFDLLKYVRETSHVTERYFLSMGAMICAEKYLRKLVLMKLKVIHFFPKRLLEIRRSLAKISV